MDRHFHNDPFFEDAPPPAMPHMGLAHRRHDPLALSPFGGMGFGHGMGIGHGMGMGLMPFGGASPFSMMNGMMRDMNTMMRSMPRQVNQGHCFSSSSTTVMQYSSDGQGGSPQVYHATTSTRQAPGGVKETRKAVKDSHTGIQRMAVGHHIGERSHVIEHSVNAKTGERAKNQEFINLDDTEADSFSSEWREKTHSFNHLGLEQSRRNHFSNSRGLPSTASRPGNPVNPVRSHCDASDDTLLLSGVQGEERERRGKVEGGRSQGEERERRGKVEGGRSKRKHRPASMNGEDLESVDGYDIHQGATCTTSRSPKLSRTKSPPPYVPKPTKAAPLSHSHSGHTHSHASTLPHVNLTTSECTAKKQANKKTVSFVP